MIHGYSASGTTFTHEAIPEPLARHLWRKGHDVWVLDLRTSAGMRTARWSWRFEDAALADIPVAIAHVRRLTGRPVDVVAHCVGAVMLGMALLADQPMLHRLENITVPYGFHRPKRWRTELAALKGNLRRVVLFQKGPMLVYSDANVVRAYFMRALRKVLFPERYEFRTRSGEGVSGNVMDRVLSTLPYPDEEFDLENPLLPWARAPWAGFRHRMDALYARDFTLANIAPRTLKDIDELFGPLNLDTVSQAIHFARKNTITDAGGWAFNTSIPHLRQRWPGGGTLSIHGTENGLADIRTLDVMRTQMEAAGIPYRTQPIAGYGHQDCLIGRDAAQDVFPFVSEFLR